LVVEMDIGGEIKRRLKEVMLEVEIKVMDVVL